MDICYFLTTGQSNSILRFPLLRDPLQISFSGRKGHPRHHTSHHYFL